MSLSINTTNSDWIECAQWLSDLNCLPPHLKQRLEAKQLQLNEFAIALRDGELLCNLALQLCPASLDPTLINKRAQMSQLLCLNNIRLFLEVCRSSQYFSMNESDLFDEHMLYDLADLACVIRTLSILSRNKNVQKRTGSVGFMHSSSNSPKLEPTPSKQIDQNDDIYYNIVPTETDAPESYYTDESFLFNGLIDQQAPNNDNSVYQTIVQRSHSSVHQPLKRDFVIREILNTEENFLDGLNTLMNDFLIPLSKILNEQDRKLICINLDKLIELHRSLYSDLFNACKGGQGRTQRICNVFENFKIKLMKEYAEYFSSIDRSLAKCDSLSQCTLPSTSDEFSVKQHHYLVNYRAKLEECRKQSKRGNFKLTDLLRLPYQRVLKYHLLFNELLKQTDVEHSAKDLIKQTRDSMCELGNYLNECQRDKENLNYIEQLVKHLCKNNDLLSNSSSSSTSSNSSNGFKSVYSNGFNFNLLKDFGHYIKDDKFRIKSIDLGERSARTRTFFLFEKALIVCKLKGNNYNYKETLLINDYSIEDPQTGGLNHSVSSTSNLTGGILSNLFNDLTNSATLNPTIYSSSLNLHSSSNQHSLLLVNNDKTKVNLIIFKNKEQKKIWKQCLLQAKDKIKPNGQRSFKHLFDLVNFDRELVKCFVCNKYLLGLFYQGYKCCLCSSIAHKDCLLKININCSAVNSSLLLEPLLNHNKPPPPLVTLERTLSNLSSTSSLKQSNQAASFCVKAIYKYDGRPPPPEFPVLLFNQGDLIQVTDDDDDEWWKGYILNTAKSIKEEGFFPRRHVKNVNETNSNSHSPSFSNMQTSSANLEECSWFSPIDRITADLILSRIPNPLSQTIFMVRCRQEGGYAISIKYNGVVDHIKINVTYLRENLGENGETRRADTYYSIDQQKNFDSIISLVNYYCQNILKDNFPQLDTTLGVPFREALPTPIGYCQAVYDYNPLVNPHNTGEQIELKKSYKYFILNKEVNGWWRVYNQEGLIGYAPATYLQEIKSRSEA